MQAIVPLTDMHVIKKDDPAMPSLTHQVVSLDMPSNFLNWYEAVESSLIDALHKKNINHESNINVFLNGVRQAANGKDWDGALSPKILWLRDNVAEWKAKGQKVVVYSTWKQFGMKIILAALLEHREDLRVRVIDGTTTTLERLRIAEAYNADQVDVLLFTAAGSEGINLIGTRHVVVLEPHWNKTRTSQAYHRAYRINSHIHLPEDDRNVTVHHLLLKKPNENCDSVRSSADVLLTKMSTKKMHVIQRFDKLLTQHQQNFSGVV